MNRFTIRMLAALIGLMISGCAMEDQSDVQLHATWQFKESTGGLLGKVTADPNDLWFLEFTQDGKVVRWDYDGKADEYYFRHFFFSGELYLQYKYDNTSEFQQFHKAIIDDNELILIPYLGKNTSCVDCPTEVFSKVESNW